MHDQDEDLLEDDTVTNMIHQRFNLTAVRVDTVEKMGNTRKYEPK